MGRRIFQQAPTAMNIPNTGIDSASGFMSTTEMDQVLFVQGSGGAIDVTTDPQIEDHEIVGAKLTLIGMSDTNTLLFEDGAGLSLNGPAELGLNDVLELMWCGDRYIELGRNF
jgi:hypothetical protein